VVRSSNELFFTCLLLVLTIQKSICSIEERLCLSLQRSLQRISKNICNIYKYIKIQILVMPLHKILFSPSISFVMESITLSSSSLAMKVTSYNIIKKWDPIILPPGPLGLHARKFIIPTVSWV
jgi:hypothetical protein